MRFAKYHGTGNDFVMIEDVGDDLHLSPQLIAALCDRHKGVGADGLIRIAPGVEGDFTMDYSNADGEVAEMCGNGIRCLAKFVYDNGLTRKTEIDVDTRAGLKHLVLDVEDGETKAVTVDMGRPALDAGRIPMRDGGDGRFVMQPLDAAGRMWTATAVSMGNPHCVLFLDPDDDLPSIDVPGIGSTIEHLPLFPNRTNVEFVRVVDGRIVLRVWERGSGETMACGTGACASLVACSVGGLTGRHAEVEFPGGVLDVAWRDDDHVFLTGPAVRVFEGELDERWLAQLSAGARR